MQKSNYVRRPSRHMHLICRLSFRKFQKLSKKAPDSRLRLQNWAFIEFDRMMRYSQNLKFAAGLQDRVVESLNVVSLEIPENRENEEEHICDLMQLYFY